MTDSTTTPALDLEAIEARAKAATMGPWVKAESDCEAHVAKVAGFFILPVPAKSEILAEEECDADFIAHARSDTPSMVAEIRSLRDEVAELKAERRDAWKALEDLPMDGETLADGIKRAIAIVPSGMDLGTFVLYVAKSAYLEGAKDFNTNHDPMNPNAEEDHWENSDSKRRLAAPGEDKGEGQP